MSVERVSHEVERSNLSGAHDDFSWAVSHLRVPQVDALVVKYFAGSQLCSSAFDGGPITSAQAELDSGWRVVDGIMVSPTLTGLEIPFDVNDEWFVLDQIPAVFPKLTRFVNYGGFNLAEPRELAASYDPTWERSGLDWLYAIQEEFWHQIELLKPKAYVILGDAEVVTSTDHGFISEFVNIARRGTS